MANTVAQVFLLALVLGTGYSSPCSDPKTWIADNVVLEVDECQIDKPCELVQGTTKAITMRFKPKQPLDSAEAVVHGIIGGIPLPFSGVNADACSNMKCPAAPTEVTVYQAQVNVLKLYPTVSVDIKFELKKGDETIACYMIPAKIVKHKSH